MLLFAGFSVSRNTFIFYRRQRSAGVSQAAVTYMYSERLFEHAAETTGSARAQAERDNLYEPSAHTGAGTFYAQPKYKIY